MDRTLLLGLDGATYTILEPLMEDGTMPFLRDFAAMGTRAALISTPNPLTPPAWISMTTGRSPGHHGVFDFIWAEERQEQVYFTLYNFRDIACETIWSMVSRQNGRVCSLNFPMMSPPPAVSGVVVPGLVSWKHLGRNSYPPEVYQRLKALPGFDPRLVAWDFELEKKAEVGISEDEYENWIRFHIRRERQWFGILRYLLQHEPCDLTGIVFDGIDKILHMGWRFLDPAAFPEAPSPWERKIRGLCLDYFRELDGFLADIAALAGPEARIFIASDHGFGPTRDVFRVNTWLHSQGYLQWKRLGEMDEQARRSVQRLIDQHFVLLDWERTTAYAQTTTSNGIYIRVARVPGQTGVPVGEYGAFRARLTAELMALRHPEDGQPMIKRVMTREEAFPGGHSGRAPDLTLVLRDHGFASIRDKEPVIAPRPKIEGTHYPQGIFLARGRGISRGANLGEASILDVAPSLLHSLGLPIPSDLEREMPAGLFEASFLKGRPCRRGEPTLPPASYALEANAHTMGAEEEEAVLQRLQALGYIE